MSVGRSGSTLVRRRELVVIGRTRLQTAEDGLIVATLTGQDSGMLTPLAKANALLRRPPFQEALAPGTLVEIIRLTL